MSSTRESLCMCDLCRKRAAAYARTEAFAAIRRAAAVARAAEDHAVILGRQGDSTFAAYAESEALGIRRAVRAAIGSEKA